MLKMVNLYKALYFFIANKFRHFRNSTIIKVVEHEYDGYVYNLSIDEDETYIADGFVVHNCRSQRIPVTKSWSELGFDGLDEDQPLNTRPFVADKRRVKDIPKSQRAQVIGTTKEKSYNDWLKTQPREFVEETLGKAKAKLYLDGNLTLDKFVNREGRELTLEQLEASESRVIKAAWSAAFGS